MTMPMSGAPASGLLSRLSMRCSGLRETATIPASVSRASAGSGDDVGCKVLEDALHLVLQVQLALLQSPHGQHIDPPLGIQRGDGVVEIAVLAHEDLELHTQDLIARHAGVIGHRLGSSAWPVIPPPQCPA